MRRCPSMCPASAGFTLVELLLSVAIAVVVAALAWSLLSTTTRVVGRQADRALGPDRAAVALDVLRADLTSLFFPTNDNACRVELIRADGAPFRFSFCTLRALERTPDVLWTEPLGVEYSIGASGDSTAALLRVSRSLSGPVAVETNVLMERIADFRVELGDGEVWTSAWSSASAEAGAFPRAARVLLRARAEDDPLEVDVWLPAGHVVTSSLIRASADAP